MSKHKRTRRTKKQNYRGGSTTVYLPIHIYGSDATDKIHTSIYGAFESKDEGAKVLIEGLVDDGFIRGDKRAIYNEYQNMTQPNKLSILCEKYDNTGGSFNNGLDGWYYKLQPVLTTDVVESMPVMR